MRIHAAPAIFDSFLLDVPHELVGVGMCKPKLRSTLLLFPAVLVFETTLASSAFAASPIDTNAPYYLSSGLTTAVLPDFQGGTLRIDQPNAIYSQNFTIENYPTNTIDLYSNSATFSGVLSGPDNALNIISTYVPNTQTAILVLTGNNTYTGGTSVSQGVLQIGSGGITGSVSGDITDNSSLIFNRSDTFSFSGNISGIGTMQQAGNGTVILLGSNTYKGGTTVNNGAKLQIGNGGGSGSISSDVQVNGTLVFDRSDTYLFMGSIGGSGELQQIGGGTLVLTPTAGNISPSKTTIGSSSTLQFGNGWTQFGLESDVVDNGSLIFNITPDSAPPAHCYSTPSCAYYVTHMTYSHAISGIGALVTAGHRILVLTGENTYTGGTTISSGTEGGLQIGNGGTTGSIVGDVVNNATLIFDRSDTVTFGGAISGTGSLQQIGTGTTVLTANNTYTGGTTITAGTLQAGNGGATGSITGNVSDNGILAFIHSNDITFSGVISGSGTLQKKGSGTLILTGTNSYTGGTTINSGSTLQVGNGGATGSIIGDVTNNGILTFNRSDTVTFDGNISGSGQLVHAGTYPQSRDDPNHSASTLILTGTNTYTGTTFIEGRQKLQIGNGGTTGSIAGDVSDLGTLIFDRSDTLTYAGNIYGAPPDTPLPHNLGHDCGSLGTCGVLIVTGGGRLIMTGRLGVWTMIDDSSTLQIDGIGAPNDIDEQGLQIRDAGTVVFNRSGTMTIGFINGTGALKLTGNGTLILPLDYRNHGGVSIGPGSTLQLGNGNVGNPTFNDVSQGTLIDNGTLVVNFSDSYPVGSDGIIHHVDPVISYGNISGVGALQQIGSRATILAGTNTYTGGTTINSGSTLQLGIGNIPSLDSDGTTGSIVGDVVDNGMLIFARTNAYTFAGNISGAGAVRQIGSGALILTGANTFIGGATVDGGGSLQIGNGGTTGSLIGNVENSAILIFNRSDAVTFSGVISGTGQLNQIGRGTTILSGENTYSGHTAISAGTLQVGNGGATGSIVGDVSDNATLAFNRSDIVTFSGIISGTGGVQQIGTGTVILTGDNTYVGGTMILAGTLQLGNGGTTGSIVGDVTDNGMFVFNRSNTDGFDGVVSGTGALKKIGGGMLVLNGANSYFGVTTLSNGMLQAGANNVFSPNSAIVMTDTNGVALDLNGYNQTINGLSGGGPLGGNVLLGAGTLTTNDGGTYNGVIFGTGGLTHGTGTLVLNGANTYTGLTTISGGTLMVGDATHANAVVAGNVAVGHGATLLGHGTILGSVSNVNGGTVMPGGSIGTLTVASYTQGPSDTLRLEITPQGASSLVVTGTATLNGSLAVDFSPGTYSAQAYNLIAAGNIIGNFSTITYNGAPANVLPHLSMTANGFELFTESTQNGQLFSDAAISALNRAQSFGAMIADRHSDPGCEPPTTCSPITVWARGFGGAGSIDGKIDAAAGFNTRWAGFVGGADYRFDTGEKFGFAYSYSQTTLNISGGWGRAVTDTLAIVVTGTLPVLGGNGSLDGDVFYMSNNTVGKRDLGGYGIATSHPGGHTIGGAVQFAYPLVGGCVEPLVRLSFANFSRSAVIESGAGSFDLATAARSYQSLLAEAGVRLSRIFKLDDGLALASELQFGMRNELAAMNRHSVIWLVDEPSTTVVVPHVNPAPVSFVARAGLEVERGDGIALFIAGDAVVNGHSREGTISVGGRINF